MQIERTDVKKQRIYPDTSVIGGCVDEEFREHSRRLMDMVREGGAVLLVSDLLLEELARAPEEVKNVLAVLPPSSLENVSFSQEAVNLRNAYLEAGVVGADHQNDAYHVALAAVARADLIVSWNFRHIVHLDKIRGFNAVNLREGYLPMEIRSPLEVV